MKTRLLFLAALLAWACSRPAAFTPRELAVIEKSDSVMYVLTVADRADSAVLRTVSTDLKPEALRSEQFRTLSAKMLATVQSPEQGGVGLAAPQVGINRRVIAVCRLDKEGEPYEVYANVHIDSLFGETVTGPEGCLSVPPLRGDVARASSVIFSYTDLQTLKIRRDTVHGYTARIFQHETDHLDGVLYIDKADSIRVDESWAEERAAFDYSKPRWMSNMNYPLPSRPDTLRILAVGNSFSDDGTEYLPDLLEGAGVHNVRLARLYIGGCSLERHMGGYNRDSRYYRYDKSLDNKWVTLDPRKGLRDALSEEPWDIVTVQQASGVSGLYDSYKPWLDELIAIVRRHCPNPDASIVWHQTWSYSRDSDHGEFPNYGRDQAAMDAAIAACVDSLKADSGISVVIPSGPAITAARRLFPDVPRDLTRDGFHLSFAQGRYTAACTWFEALIKPTLGVSVKGNPALPEAAVHTPDGTPGLTAEAAALCQKAAIEACR